VLFFEAEIAAAVRVNDFKYLAKLIERIHAETSENEDSLRLLALANERLGRFNRAEHHLKKILAMNTQSLWAANSLGKLYLRTGRPDEGIEILQRLSYFHNLNSERCLEL